MHPTSLLFNILANILLLFFSEHATTSELETLFPGGQRSRYTNRLNSRGKKAKREKTWTGKFFCLSDKEKETTPSCEEKALQKSNLGLKKIQMVASITQEQVKEVLVENFPPLKQCGGFELMRCGSGRQLKFIDGKWDCKTLNETIGSQAQIYIRPIQRNIRIEEENNNSINSITEKCLECNRGICISELRNHIMHCSVNCDQQSSDDSQNPVSVGQPLEPQLNLQSHVVSNNIDHALLYESVNIPNSTEQIPIPSAEETVNTSNELDTLIYLAGINENTNVSEQTEPGVELEETFVYSNESVTDIVNSCVKYCIEQEVKDPVDILRIYQKRIVTGRQLDISSEAETIEGETNEINVDRTDLLRSAFDEIQYITDLCLCLEVQYYNEVDI